MIVIASIHQPATSTYLLFDQVLLLSQGKSVYFGPSRTSQQYFESLGYPHDPFLSPPEAMLQLVNADFDSGDNGKERLDKLIVSWEGSPQRQLLLESIEPGENNKEVRKITAKRSHGYPRPLVVQIWILLHRMFLVTRMTVAFKLIS